MLYCYLNVNPKLKKYYYF